MLSQLNGGIACCLIQAHWNCLAASQALLGDQLLHQEKELKAFSENHQKCDCPKTYTGQILCCCSAGRGPSPHPCPNSMLQKEGSRLQAEIPHSTPGESSTFPQFQILLVEKFLLGCFALTYRDTYVNVVKCWPQCHTIRVAVTA